MSDRKIWKMLHVLRDLKTGQTGLAAAELNAVGVDCNDDSVLPLVDSQAVTLQGGIYSLTPAARTILNHCIVANKQRPGDDLRVDYPSAFVVMPFSESWSDPVYERLIKPAIEGAALQCIRGDTVLRIGELTSNLWNALMRAGLVVADVSALNANVFYELWTRSCDRQGGVHPQAEGRQDTRRFRRSALLRVRACVA